MPERVRDLPVWAIAAIALVAVLILASILGAIQSSRLESLGDSVRKELGVVEGQR